MPLSELQVEEIVRQVLTELAPAKPEGQPGICESVEEALRQADRSHKILYDISMKKREEAISNIRRLTLENAERLARLGVKETKMGRVEDKIAKHILVAEKTPGTECLTPTALSGDYGLTLTERAPYGVIAAVTPSTNPSETVICNTIGMMASGNTVVFNPHPSAKETSLQAIELVNRGAKEAGLPNVAFAAKNPTPESFSAMIASPIVRMVVCTGGPGIVKLTLSSGKKAIAAGAGNPPVIIDESACLEKAARDVIAGASFDNNLPCIAEKEAFVLASVYDDFLSLLVKNGAVLVSPEDTKRLEKLVLTEKEGKYFLNRRWVGQDASLYLDALGIASNSPRLIICEAEPNDLFVQEELMMPILPIVKAKNIDEAIALSVQAEHGYRHSAHMHSKNVDHLTRFARAAQTTIFVKNAPSYAGLGFKGEGHCTFTIAGPTGEGLTNAASFTRSRRCIMADSLHIV
ncbi:MAG: aldehyde dehydrogenase EutE [Clostridiales bacterium]|nr:aldehyde dehydrogenase EutE [Clostridiales bacterium]